YEVKLLIMHRSGLRPNILSHGKIAGLSAISVVSNPTQHQPEGFFDQTFGGGLWVQSVRLISYTFGFMLLVFAIVIPSSSISDKLTERSRGKLVERFKRETELTISNRDEFIFLWFIDRGQSYLERVVRAASDEETLGERVRKALERNTGAEYPYDLSIDHVIYV